MISRWAGDSLATQARRIALVLLRSSEVSGVSASSAISQHVVLVDVLVLALAQRGQRLEAGDRQQPGRDLRAAFELAGGAPHVQEHLADEVFGHRGVAHHAQDEAVDADVVAGIEHVHRGAVALGDALQQHLVRCRAGSGNDASRAAALMAMTFCMTGSQFALGGASLGGLLVSHRFGMSARKAENGFVQGRIVSSQRPRRNIRAKMPMISMA